MLALLAFAAFSAYLTRTAISAAATTIERELALSHEQMGVVFAAFSTGYFWFQIPAGWIGTRRGRRATLAAFGALWSLCAGLTAVAHSMTTLWLTRFGMGVTQAGLVPNAGKALDDWFPERNRGLASAVLGSSMSAGAVLASGLTAVLLPVIGWRAVYALYAVQGIAWAMTFWFLFRDAPNRHPWVNRLEGELLQRPAPAGEQKRRLSLRSMACRGSLWANCGQSFFRAFGFAFFITWFPAYLEKAHGVRVTSAGLLTMVPLVGVVAGSLAGGVLIDRLLRATGSKWVSRSLMAAAALLLTATATLAASWADTPVSAVLVIGLGSVFLGASGPASWAATIDIGGQQTALVFGIMNTVGVLGDLACPLAVGRLFSVIERGGASWNSILFLFAAVHAAGAVSWLLLNPNSTLED